MRGLNFGIAPILPERFKGDLGRNSRPNFVLIDACKIGGRMCEMSESRLPVQPRIKSLMLLTGRRLGNQRSSVKKHSSISVGLHQFTSRLPVQPRIKSLLLLTGRRLGNQRSIVKKHNSISVGLRRTSGGWKSARIAK